MFVSTAAPGGGQEATVMDFLSTLTHHGIIYVPFGYATGFDRLKSIDEVHGGKSNNPSTIRRYYYDNKRYYPCRISMGSWHLCRALPYKTRNGDC